MQGADAGIDKPPSQLGADVAEIESRIDEQQALQHAFMCKICCVGFLLIAGLVAAAAVTQQPLIAIGVWPVLAFLLTAAVTTSFGPKLKFDEGAMGHIFGPAFVPPGWTQMWDPMNCCVVWRNDATGNVQFFPPPVMRGQERLESKATLTVDRDGSLVSTDDLIVNDRDELWNFIRLYASPPRLAVRVHGSHTERRHRHGSHGHGSRRASETETREVTDFLYCIDANDAVSALDVDLSAAGEPVEEFTGCNARLKEFKLKKVFEWNLPFLVEAITLRCRELGYHDEVRVDLVVTGDSMRVYRNTRRARLYHSFWFRYVLLAFLPPLACLLWACWRCGVAHFKAEARFQSLMSAEQWLQTHYHEIRTDRVVTVQVPV
ncbi:MAG: hypothetical protein MHM6MM_002112 [Cercozoa sp. M6MM]